MYCVEPLVRLCPCSSYQYENLQNAAETLLFQKNLKLKGKLCEFGEVDSDVRKKFEDYKESN
jgi:hypothetical protein